MGISGLAGKKNITSIDIELKIPQEIYANNEAIFQVVIKNKKRFIPSYILNIKILDKDIFIPYVENNTEYRTFINKIFSERGVYRVEKIYICSVFPFNFFRRCIDLNLNYEFFVFPKPEKSVAFSDKRKDSRKKEEISTYKKGYEGDLISIREYKTGDPLKYIHWKASAKTGKLKTKEFSNSFNKPVVIDIDSIEGNIEKKVSCAVYLILDLYRRSVPFGLKTGEKFFKPEYSYRHKLNLLKELAVYGKNKG